MKKIFVALGVFVLLAVIFLFLKKQSNPSIDIGGEKISVVTSFYPLYFFASEIGGDMVRVSNLTPSGVEPHDFEPTARDIISISESRLFILNGLGLEAWADDVLKNIDSQKTEVLIVGEVLKKENLVLSGEGDGHTHDPHVWLSPKIASFIVEHITDSFVRVDPSHADVYRERGRVLKGELSSLDTLYRDSVAVCSEKSFVTSHDAFRYLASEYGLTEVSIAGLSPDEEPSLSQLRDIAHFAKSANIKYIFFEELVSPKLSETIAHEIGAQTLVLDPLEGLSRERISEGENYVTVMKKNLENLKRALGCK